MFQVLSESAFSMIADKFRVRWRIGNGEVLVTEIHDWGVAGSGDWAALVLACLKNGGDGSPAQ